MGCIAASWDRGDPSLYGRIDLFLRRLGPAKLLEYNADTPTALYETGVFSGIGWRPASPTERYRGDPTSSTRSTTA